MTKKIWDLYAPIYKQAMKADQHIYDFMYQRIPERIQGMEVLEIATGPGLLAKHVAPATKKMIATDYSDGMIAEAEKIHGVFCEKVAEIHRKAHGGGSVVAALHFAREDVAFRRIVIFVRNAVEIGIGRRGVGSRFRIGRKDLYRRERQQQRKDQEHGEQSFHERTSCGFYG